jgi:hypothetical protein
MQKFYHEKFDRLPWLRGLVASSLPVGYSIPKPVPAKMLVPEILCMQTVSNVYGVELALPQVRGRFDNVRMTNQFLLNQVT